MRLLNRNRFSRLCSMTGLTALAARAYRWSGVVAFNYHRIGTAKGSLFDHGLWSANEDAFRDQLRFLKTNFDIVSPPDLPDIVAGRRGRYVMVTFDDGYIDNYTTAFPILGEAGVRATFFVTTGFIDTPRPAWWDEIAWMVRSSPNSPLK